MADGSDTGNAAVIAEANAKAKVNTSTKSDRGHVGKGTAGSRLKSLFRATGKGLTLKEFARTLDSGKSEDASEWFSNKGGSLEKKAQAAREKAKGGTIRAQALATKAARTKSKK